MTNRWVMLSVLVLVGCDGGRRLLHRQHRSARGEHERRHRVLLGVAYLLS